MVKQTCATESHLENIHNLSPGLEEYIVLDGHVGERPPPVELAVVGITGIESEGVIEDLEILAIVDLNPGAHREVIDDIVGDYSPIHPGIDAMVKLVGVCTPDIMDQAAIYRPVRGRCIHVHPVKTEAPRVVPISDVVNLAIQDFDVGGPGIGRHSLEGSPCYAEILK